MLGGGRVLIRGVHICRYRQRDGLCGLAMCVGQQSHARGAGATAQAMRGDAILLWLNVSDRPEKSRKEGKTVGDRRAFG